MYSTTKTVKESDSLKPPDLKPALQLFEETVSDTIIKWFNANKQTNEKLGLRKIFYLRIFKKEWIFIICSSSWLEKTML